MNNSPLAGSEVFTVVLTVGAAVDVVLFIICKLRILLGTYYIRTLHNNIDMIESIQNMYRKWASVCCSKTVPTGEWRTGPSFRCQLLMAHWMT